VPGHLLTRRVHGENAFRTAPVRENGCVSPPFAFANLRHAERRLADGSRPAVVPHMHISVGRRPTVKSLDNAGRGLESIRPLTACTACTPSVP
jgi:hypothetical protein